METVSSEYIFDDTWLKARKDVCLRPDGKIVETYYVMEYMTWVTGVAFTEDNKIIMVQAIPPCIGESCMETPGGCVDDTDASLKWPSAANYWKKPGMNLLRLNTWAIHRQILAPITI